MTIVANAFIDEIDERIAKRSLLKHPFYQAWTKGELSVESLRDYACQYYRHVSAFPTYLSAVHAQTEDINTRREILKNLNDEEAGTPNHPDLWVQFGEGFGLGAAEMENADIRPETSDLIGTFRSVCGGRGTAAGLAALYAYESQIPEVSETKIDGLKKFYGLDNHRALAYFQVHIEADKEHAAAERELLEKHIDDRDFEIIRRSVDETLDALYGLLDGVCQRHGIAC